MAANDYSIVIDHLWKRYGLPLPSLYYACKKKAAALCGRNSAQSGELPWALQDIALQVRRGETLGVIGRNGAGKSTLLKILAGVTPPTSGNIRTSGRIFSMIELSAGMHMDLTGRENTMLLGTIAGIPFRELRRKLPAIEEFCELGDWFERPVRMYSSGMLARLGFAVAMNVEADILLIDEILAVGDITFQRKCLEAMEQMQGSGKTIIFVSHAIRQIERLCGTTLLLDGGRQVNYGRTADVVSDYYEAANIKIIEQHSALGTIKVAQALLEEPVIETTGVRLLDASGTERTCFQTGESMTIEVAYKANKPVDAPIIGMSIATVDSLHLSGFTNEHEKVKISLHGTGIFSCTIHKLPLLSGIYTIQLKIQMPSGIILGGGYGLAIFNVQVPQQMRLAMDYGLIGLDVQWHR